MIWPETSAVNLRPTLTGSDSPLSAVAGVAKSKIVRRGTIAAEAADWAPVPTAFVAETLNV